VSTGANDCRRAGGVQRLGRACRPPVCASRTLQDFQPPDFVARLAYPEYRARRVKWARRVHGIVASVQEASRFEHGLPLSARTAGSPFGCVARRSAVADDCIVAPRESGSRRGKSGAMGLTNKPEAAPGGVWTGHRPRDRLTLHMPTAGRSRSSCIKMYSLILFKLLCSRNQSRSDRFPSLPLGERVIGAASPLGSPGVHPRLLRHNTTSRTGSHRFGAVSVSASRLPCSDREPAHPDTRQATHRPRLRAASGSFRDMRRSRPGATVLVNAHRLSLSRRHRSPSIAGRVAEEGTHEGPCPSCCGPATQLHRLQRGRADVA